MHVTFEPPTRWTRLCTPVPGRPAAARRYAMAFGRPCPRTCAPAKESIKCTPQDGEARQRHKGSLRNEKVRGSNPMRATGDRTRSRTAAHPRPPAARTSKASPDPTGSAHLVSIPATGSVSCETPHHARHHTCDLRRLRLRSRWIHPWRTPIQRRPGTRLGSVLGPCSLRTLWCPRRRCSDRHTALPQVIVAASRLSRVTSEPPTRCSRICTPAPGRKGAARRRAIASGHPCPQTPTSKRAGYRVGGSPLPASGRVQMMPRSCGTHRRCHGL